MNKFYAELSYFEKVGNDFKNLSDGTLVNISEEYAAKFFTSASDFSSTVVVGKEDKLWTAKQIAEAEKKGEDMSNVNVGDLRLKGMKTLWNEIGSMPFTVTYQKVGKKLSEKAFQKKTEELAAKMLAEIEAAQVSKKGVKDAATKCITEVLANPPARYEQGEMRTLVGTKIQYSSEDGFYQVKDFEATDGNARTVNINTIESLVYKDVCYMLEK